MRVGSYTREVSQFVPRAASVVRFLFIVLASVALSRSAWASFEELPTGARQAGLGGSFAGLADDVLASYYNPAGLAQLNRSELNASYSKLYSGLTDGSSISRSYVAYGHPTAKRGTFGVSYLSLSLAGLYSESTMSLHYAHSVRDRWNLGGSLKFLKKSFGTDAYTDNAINSDTGASLGAPDPLFAQNGTSKSAASFDLGAQYRISRIYGLGLAILNLNSPNMALSTSDTDKVGSIYKAALARRTKISAVNVEISAREFTSREFRFLIGGERWLKGGFGFRGGLGFGQRQYQMTSLGFSYRWDNLQVDYALIYPLSGVKGTFGTNQVSMSFRFGRKN